MGKPIHRPSNKLPSTVSSVVLVERPKGGIEVGKTFKLIEKPAFRDSDVKDGEVLIEVLYLSLDPAMRGWLNDVRSYVPPVGIGETMRGATISKILISKSPSLSPGSYVLASPGWTTHAILPSTEVQPLTVPSGGRITDGLGVLGFTGLTAYFGLLNIGHVQAGDFVVVSGAAGATGSVVCQIAKLKGAKVLGIAGSDEKVTWLKELGCDEALNYKSATFATDFRAKTKDLIDVFFDNVGGFQLELALSRAKPHARFVMCGAISQYNSSEPVGPKNISMVIAMRIKMEGFIVLDFVNEFDAARKELTAWLNEGKLQRKETIIKGGLGVAEQGLADLYKGVNTGKLLIEVKAHDGGRGEASRL